MKDTLAWWKRYVRVISTFLCALVLTFLSQVFGNPDGMEDKEDEEVVLDEGTVTFSMLSALINDTGPPPSPRATTQRSPTPSQTMPDHEYPDDPF